MDLYTLDAGFQKKDVIDEFASIVWTERYSAAGDVKLVVPANVVTAGLLSEGTFLGVDGSNEVMLLETQSIENGLLTVTGNTLLNFLNERVIHTSTASDPDTRAWGIMGMTPGAALGHIVQQHAISGPFLAGPSGSGWDNYGIGNYRNKIPNLALGAIYNVGSPIDLVAAYGSVYEALKAIAETHKLGMSLYLSSASSSGYSLLFRSYRGVNRTSSQGYRPVVRFASSLDSLSDVRELRSITGYKTVCYVFVPDKTNGIHNSSGIAIAPGITTDPVGFDRRVLVVYADDIPQAIIDGDDGVLSNILHQRALNELANNNYVKILDGEVVPQSEFQYGIHYGLGDIVELQGYTELSQKARITEYIRTQDATGERAYPTVSVIDSDEDLNEGSD